MGDTASAALAVLLSLARCEDGAAPEVDPPPGPPGETAPTTGEPAPDPPEEAPPAEAHYVNAAVRCGECHASAYDEWRESAHARSAVSAAYVAMTARASATECAACHAPLSGVIPEPHLVEEGIT